MLVEKTGNLFDSDAPVIGHGVNCVGKMGAGIAVEFRRRYPKMYNEYVKHCEKGILLPGDVFFHRETFADKMVANLATQFNPGANAKYVWLQTALVKTFRYMTVNDWGDTLALPRIGCGLGGLEWLQVKQIIDYYSGIHGMTVEVWTL